MADNQPQHADGVRERFGPGDDVPWVYVTSLLDEIEQTKPFIENYYRLLAEDEGTWADWARDLAGALEYVLDTPMGGYEQADAYIKARGVGRAVLKAYRETQSDGTACGSAGTLDPTGPHRGGAS